MPAARALLVSNGLSEDLIVGIIARGLQAEGVEVTAYPLVGMGAHPPDIPLLDPRRDLPSAGFSFRAGLRGLGADVAGGIVGLWFGQRRTLHAQRGRYDIVIAVGDTYCLYMAGAASSQVTFVATADSANISPFGFLPRVALRRFAGRIFTRDPETAAALKTMGCRAECVGVVMLDQLRISGETFGLDRATPVVALLPGSRRDAPDNAALLTETAEAISREAPEVRFLMPIAFSVSSDDVRARIGTARPPITLTPLFADVLSRADVVIGLAGTANEQAAGLGKPVVAFPGYGAQFGPSFLTTQHRLLGDALQPTANAREAAAVALALLRDPEECRRRGEIGRRRMGPPGATRRLVSALLALLEPRTRPVSGESEASSPVR